MCMPQAPEPLYYQLLSTSTTLPYTPAHIQDEPSYQLQHLDMLLAASAYGRTELLWYMQHVGEAVPVAAKGALPLFQAAATDVVEADCQVLLLLAALVRVYEGLVSGLAGAEVHHTLIMLHAAPGGHWLPRMQHSYQATECRGTAHTRSISLQVFVWPPLHFVLMCIKSPVKDVAATSECCLLCHDRPSTALPSEPTTRRPCAPLCSSSWRKPQTPSASTHSRAWGVPCSPSAAVRARSHATQLRLLLLCRRCGRWCLSCR
jgi:hypothetical protein